MGGAHLKQRCENETENDQLGLMLATPNVGKSGRALVQENKKANDISQI